ncbi:MmgE/PrpD family protein [Alcaligenaceae bacterium C4P045]|nr:MmgE/PrpD family protein [Alcaligenaceae bacterium C4P045]
MTDADTHARPSLLQHLALLLTRPVEDADRARAATHLSYWRGSAALAAAGAMGEPLWQAAAGAEWCADQTLADARHVAHFQYEASLGSLYEMDDTHRAALVHPGPIVMPVARHLARLTGASEHLVLDAIVRGYDAMIRLGLAMGPSHYALWHNTATCGNVGAAATAASLLGLDATRTAHALALAVTRASGLWQIRLEPCDGKAWHASQAAQTGLQAAWMAHAGLHGPAHALEGEKGMFAAMCPDARPLALLPEAPWTIHETSLKPWPACRHAHPAIAAALRLREQLPARVTQQIARIDVHTYADALAFCDRTHPATPLQARFSLQHTVAAALLWGEVWMPTFEPAAIGDATCTALRARVGLHTDAEINARYPAHFGASVSIELADGTHLSETAHDAPGDPEMPIDDHALRHLVDRMLHDAGWTHAMRDAGPVLSCTDLPLRTAYIMGFNGTAPRG